MIREQGERRIAIADMASYAVKNSIGMGVDAARATREIAVTYTEALKRTMPDSPLRRSVNITLWPLRNILWTNGKRT